MPSGVPRIPQPREWILTKCCPLCKETKPWAKFSPLSYWPDGSVYAVNSRCHDCQSKRTAESKLRWEQENRVKRNAQKLRWQHARKDALRAETVPKHDVLLDPAPFQKWIKRMSLDVGGQGVLAELCGVNPRSLYRVTVGEQEHVSLSLVDRCLTALGDHVNDIYDFDLEAA